MSGLVKLQALTFLNEASMGLAYIASQGNITATIILFAISTGMPSISVYIRKANYEEIRQRAEAAGKSIGAIINELIQQMD